jgi:predicted PurR-regulated permease PerM
MAIGQENGRARLPDSRKAGPLAGATIMPETLPPLMVLLGAIAVLYFAREVFMPLAIAVLLTFALAPVVSLIRKTGLPRMPAVVAAVTAAFIAISAFSFVVVTQVSELAQQLPTYQSNILTKIRSAKDSGAGSGVVKRITDAVERVGKEISQPEDAGKTLESPRPATPILVEIYAPEKPIQLLTSMILPLVGPLATAGLVVVVVIFMLLEREDLRDRFIRLVGYSDLHRTTEALQDAGSRVGRYLLMQLVVNVTYGIPIAVGLWLIGIPNATLWGALAIILRFVPYIGPIISMVLPLFLAVAVSPDWSLMLWVAALFLVMELISNNVVEPWLYGSRTGLSPLAIIVAAIFWTWLWGPVGLVLSTPLTVCLVVLGKHVPQFRFFEVLFGSEPVLDPEARLYQRLLAHDPDEATDQLDELLEEQTLPEVYGRVAIPALILAERDRARGVMSAEQREGVAATARRLVANLSDLAEPRAGPDEAEEREAMENDEEAERNGRPSSLAGRKVLCLGGRNVLDDASAAMLAQVLVRQGADASSAGFADLEAARLRELLAEGADAVLLCLLSRDSLRHGRFLVRRLKRARPDLRIGLVFWRDAAEARSADENAAAVDADFVAHDIEEAIAGLGPAGSEPAAAA